MSAADLRVDLSGRRAVVTGANTGLGFVTARALARAGAEVVLTARDPAKGSAAVARIQTERPRGRVSVTDLDLADLGSVAACADRLLTGPVDLLVNNAGLMLVPERQWTADGFELHMGVNHLAHFALTARLLPALQQAPAARVVSLSSIAARTAGPLDPRLGAAGMYAPFSAYAQSKLACALFGLELDRRLKANGSPVTSVVAHPGVSATELFGRQRSASVYHRLTALVSPVVGTRPEQGARPQLRAATDSSLTGGELIGPRFLVRGGPVREAPSVHMADRASAALLWESSALLTGVTFGW